MGTSLAPSSAGAVAELNAWSRGDEVREIPAPNRGGASRVGHLRTTESKRKVRGLCCGLTDLPLVPHTLLCWNEWQSRQERQQGSREWLAARIQPRGDTGLGTQGGSRGVWGRCLDFGCILWHLLTDGKRGAGGRSRMTHVFRPEQQLRGWNCH